MRGTPSCSTTSACLPSARKIWQHASADPTASPSGRACEVSTKRSRCSICRRTSCNITLFFLIPLPLQLRFGSSLVLLRALACPRQQFFHSSLFLLRPVQPEIQLGSPSQSQSLNQLVTDIFAGCFQTLDAPICVLIVPLHIDPNLRGPAIIGNVDGCYAHQPDARIGQLAFHQSLNLLAQGLAYSAAMVLEPTLLQTSPRIKLMTIPENRSPVLARKPHCLALSWGWGKYRSNKTITGRQSCQPAGC